MEKHFKNKLKNHKVDWDKNDLLEPLKKELVQNKSNFNRKILLLLPLLFIVTCWAVTERYPTSDKQGITTINSPSIPTSLKTVNKVASLNNNQTERVQTNEYPSSNQGIKKQLNKTLHSDKIQNPTNKQLKDNSNLSKPISITNQFVTNKKKTTTSNKVIEAISNPISNQRNTILDVDVNTNPNVENQKNENPNQQPVVLDHSKNVTKDLTKNSITNENNLVSKNQTNVIDQQKTEHSSTDSLAQSIVQNQETNPLINDQKEGNTVESDDLTTSNMNAFYLGGNTEVAIVQKTSQFQNSNAAFLEKLIENENTITPRLSLSYQLWIGYQFKSGWSIQSGLQYQEIIEALKYDQRTLTSSVEDHEKARYFINKNADTLFFNGPIAIKKTEDRKVRHRNKHTFFSIPLEIGYQHHIKKVSITGNVGINYIMTHQFKGRVNELYLDGTNEIIDNPLYTLKNRLGYQLSLGIDYPITEQLSTSIKIGYRRSSTLITASNQQSYQMYSIGAGFRFFLSKQ